METVLIFYNNLEYFMAIWYNLWRFGEVCGHLVYFSLFRMFGPKTIWQPLCTVIFDGRIFSSRTTYVPT
jgi:hypothetical protein